MSTNGEVSVDRIYNKAEVHSIVNNIYILTARSWLNNGQRRHPCDVTRKIVKALRKRSIRW